MSAEVSSPPLATKRPLDSSGMDYGYEYGQPSLKRRLGNTFNTQLQGCTRRQLSSSPSDLEGPRSKRMRTLNFQHAEEERDLPVYSQRQAEAMQEAKQQEIARLREEFHKFAQQKQAELQGALEQNYSMSKKIEDMQKTEGKLTEQNKVLKRAVQIQNQQKQQSASEVEGLKCLLQQAAEQMKRLEQTNYALSVHLQAHGQGNGRNNFDQGPPPPNVF